MKSAHAAGLGTVTGGSAGRVGTGVIGLPGAGGGGRFVVLGTAPALRHDP